MTDITTPPITDDSAGDDKVTLITKEGLEKLKEELRYLKEVKRKEVAERLREAISYGDLSENAEYEEAKNEQAFTEGRILALEEKIKNAKIIADKHETGKGATVVLGSTVVIQNLSSSSKPEEEYTIVGSTEADPIHHKISNVSPVGKGLLGQHAGSTVKVSTPGGALQYKILKVK
ncbi:transcription elongation factor GreA [Candidatus Peregrinibacteria bacterium CG11_big_fil_rev_8_21_14_0_20_46_8]|nr:MAG: transcription elongation factor GreA [Candidatus Peregrinibacteria bacterium CG11_big_fil_rev_8_21_14_0_20_46_8]